MKKIRKGKKMLLILLAAVLIVIAVVLIVKQVNKNPENPEVPEEQPVIQLPETTYSNMEVRNVSMQLLKGNSSDGRDETVVSMEIHNTTESKVENENLTAVLIGPDETILGDMPTMITSLDVGEQYEISVILKGDLTATTQIKLIKN